MFNTLAIIFPLIFVATAGYISAARSFLTAEHLSGISRFVFYISIPAFLFVNMSQAELSKAVSLDVMLSFYLPVIGLYLLVLGFYRCRCGQWSISAIRALGACYSNTVLIGLPIAMQALGKHVAATVFVIITFHSALLFLLTYSFAGKEQRVTWPNIIRQLVINPVILAIALGLLANAVNLALPQVINEGLTLLAEPAIAGALFVLGANLHHYQIKPGIKSALTLTLLKLAVLPTLVYLTATYGFALAQKQTLLLVLLSASPLGVNAYLVSKQLQRESATLASAVVLSTLLSVVSFVLWLAVLSS
ncbi:AEC family transporter [Pseudoalteromonas sp. CnMc7-15]|uniref:AEC family transporter n=1 Tax=unclassified Pseudoalteromonas TaxID=194690 RepID=UPI001EF4AAC1|nr:AEC family transporter [Pseudoalteromonas sp. CnMc7-15]MCG7566695.1 AEC family transporter [Pseudoalteromonas sp. CnMc7-15]